MGNQPEDGRIGSILHADLDAFYASVEQRDDPALRGRPVIVGGGVVLAGSYEARARGVRTAMGGRQALRLCPDAVVVPPRFDAYVEASRAVFAIFRRTAETPLYRIEKRPKLRARQGLYAVVGMDGRVLRRGQDLDQVLKVLEKRLIGPV